jgi:hypothetical protein
LNVSVTISRLYDDYATATEVLHKVELVGIPSIDISIVASNADNWHTSNGTKSAANKIEGAHKSVDDRAEGAATGAGIGAAAGGVAGLLAGLGMIAIPGIGPVVAVGWLASTAAIAAVGGVTGGVLGALTEAGVSKEDAHVYAEGVRRGGTLLTVRVPNADKGRVEAILDRAAVNVRERETTYRKTGWSSFDPDVPPFTADQVRKERDLYRRKLT